MGVTLYLMDHAEITQEAVTVIKYYGQFLLRFAVLVFVPFAHTF